MRTALRRLGFQAVFDTNFSADLTIMEETTEFLNRVGSGGVMPLPSMKPVPQWQQWSRPSSPPGPPS